MISRSKKAMINTIFEIILEVVTAICSFILPRLILSHFGSSYNGITTSISQFISCISLLKSGIGSVTRAALYKPLSRNDSKSISEVVNATSGFMRKIAVIFSIAVIGFAALYPFLRPGEFEWLFSFTLVLILSISTFAQYFFGLSYQMVIQADQRNYIISITMIITTILNTIIASVLIVLGFGIHVVKLGSTIVFLIPPFFYNFWVRKKYKIDKTVAPNYKLIEQRWDAFGHQVANFINNNTDIMITTIFLGFEEVSVYGVYHTVGTAVKKGVTAISTGTTAAFGNMIAKNETKVLNSRFSQFEILIFYISTFLLTVSSIMITPFVSVYTKGVNDADYNRPLFGYLICLSVFLACIKLPYEQMVYAAGQFKKTRNGAFLEAIINIVTSIILVNFIGLIGIMIGTILALSYRTIRYNIFVSKNIVYRNPLWILKNIGYSTVTFIICFILNCFLPLNEIEGYLQWGLLAIVVSLITIVIGTILAFVFYQSSMIEIFKLLFKTITRKSSKNR